MPPAKSSMPRLVSQPPPQTQWATGKYTSVAHKTEGELEGGEHEVGDSRHPRRAVHHPLFAEVAEAVIRRTSAVLVSSHAVDPVPRTFLFGTRALVLAASAPTGS